MEPTFQSIPGDLTHHTHTAAPAPNLPREHVELEVGNVVVSGEVDGGLERHGLEARVDGVHLRQAFPKRLPRHQRPNKTGHTVTATAARTPALW